MAGRLKGVFSVNNPIFSRKQVYLRITCLLNPLFGNFFKKKACINQHLLYTNVVGLALFFFL